MSNVPAQSSGEMQFRTYFDRSEVSRRFLVDNPQQRQEITAENGAVSPQVFADIEDRS